MTTSATPSSDSWILRLVGGAGTTATWANARLVFLEAGANDAYAESRAHTFWTSPTSDSSQTTVSLTHTPASGKDYLYLGFVIGDKVAAANTNFVAELTDGTTSTGEQWVAMPQTVERIPIALPLKLTGAGASKTLTLKVREQGTGGTVIGVADCCIIAIRLDRFANVYSDQDTSTGSPATSASYVATNADQTFTPAAADHFTLAGGMFSGVATATANAKYDDGGTIVIAPQFRQNVNGTNSPFLAPRIATYAASSRRQKIEHKSSSGQVNTWQPFIFTFDLTGI